RRGRGQRAAVPSWTATVARRPRPHPGRRPARRRAERAALDDLSAPGLGRRRFYKPVLPVCAEPMAGARPRPPKIETQRGLRPGCPCVWTPARGLLSRDGGGVYAHEIGQCRRKRNTLLRDPRSPGSSPEFPERLRRYHFVRQSPARRLAGAAIRHEWGARPYRRSVPARLRRDRPPRPRGPDRPLPPLPPSPPPSPPPLPPP